MKERTITLRELLAEEQVVAPCVFDNISVRAVELAGYTAAVLSGAGLAYSMCGVPDMGLLNAEELLWMTNRLTDYTPLPVVVDAGNGYGESPSAVYITALRLAKSGAMAITIDDTTGVCGTDRSFAEDAAPAPVVPFDVYLAKVKAAVKACENTDCIVIAKTVALASLGMEEAIRRCSAARAIGAELTMIEGVHTLAQAEEIATADVGMKVWPDLTVVDGAPEVDISDLDRLGFRLVIMHYTEKAAFFGMLYYGKRTREDGNTVFHDTHDFDGILSPGQDYHELFSFWKKWLPMEDEFNDLSDIMQIEHEIKAAE